MKLNDSHKQYLVDQTMEYYGNNQQRLITIFTLNQETFGINFYGNIQGENFNTKIINLVIELIKTTQLKNFISILRKDYSNFAKELDKKQLISILNDDFETNIKIYIKAYQASKREIIIGEKKAENMENIIDNLNTVECDYSYNYMKFVVYLLMIEDEENLDENLKYQLKGWLDDNVNKDIQSKLYKEIKEINKKKEEEQNPCLLVAIRSKSDEYVVDAWFIKNLDQYRNFGSGCDQLITQLNTDKKLTGVEEMVRTLIQECTNKDILLQAIHIFLPNKLINYPVDCWKENENENTIGGMYNVIIRCSERLEVKNVEILRWKKHKDSLNNKFNELANKIFVLGDVQEEKKLEKEFIKQKAIAVKIISVFSKEQPGKLLFDSFVPLALWIREKRDDIDNQAELDSLLHDICLQDLPEKVKDKRFDAMYEDLPDNHVGSHLCLFWDDPNLLPPTHNLSDGYKKLSF